MLFNNADLVVLVSNNTTTVKTGPGVASPNVVIPSNTWSQFISTNGFYDQRQAMQMDAVMLNVSNMNNWVGTNSTLYSQLGNRTLQSVYIADLRSTNSTSQPAVYLTNGAILPPTGLSIVTPDPAYVVGNWNIKTNATGSSDAGLNSTAYTYPSAIYADAVTVLSPSWNPANSTANISSRAASSDTVNAAVLTGNVPSNNSYYSGGVENFLRFLEDWSNDTLTYNGSLVCMFPSQISTGAWPGTGTVYNPPTRNWSFDLNFNNPTKLPPLTPRASAVVRGKWATLPPQTTSF
jgi:hypothetical protein